MINIILCIFIGYAIGCVNPAVIISKAMHRDLRNEGTGNYGASNVTMVVGRGLGAFVMLFDVAKGAVSYMICAFAFGEDPTVAGLIGGFGAALGHSYPFYNRFRGGKGLACLGGIILYYDWRYFLIALGVEIVVALLSDYICFVPLTAAVGFPISYLIMRRDLVGTLILCVASVVIILRHLENLKRIANGTELHISYLWNKDKEFDRMRKTTGKSEKDYLIEEDEK